MQRVLNLQARRRLRPQPAAGLGQPARGDKPVAPQHIARGNEIIELRAVVERWQVVRAPVVVREEIGGRVRRVIRRAGAVAGGIVLPGHHWRLVGLNDKGIAEELAECGRVGVVACRDGVGSGEAPHVESKSQQREPAQLGRRPPAQPDAQIVAGIISDDLEWIAGRRQDDRHPWDDANTPQHIARHAGGEVDLTDLIGGDDRDLLRKRLAGAQRQARIHVCKQAKHLGRLFGLW